MNDGNRYYIKIFVCKFFDKNVSQLAMWNISELTDFAYVKEFLMLANWRR